MANFRGMTESPYGKGDIESTSSLSKNMRKDLVLLGRIMNNGIKLNVDKQEKLYSDYEMEYFVEDKYDKGIIVLNYIDSLIENQLNVLEIENNTNWVFELVKFYKENKLGFSGRSKKWLEIGEPIREDNIVKLEERKKELSFIKEEIVLLFRQGGNDGKIVNLVNNSEEGIIKIPIKDINEVLLKEENIQGKLKINSSELHRNIFSAYNGKMHSRGQELEGSWQMKQYFYESELRSEGYFDKKEITFVVVEDKEKYRDRIINLLPEELKKFNLNFIHFDNLEGIKSFLLIKTIFRTKENVIYLFDNYFFEKEQNRTMKVNTWEKLERKIKIDAGVELFNWVKENKPDILDRIAILSTETKEELEKKFGKDVKIIIGKGSVFTEGSSIASIGEWTRSIIKEEK